MKLDFDVAIIGGGPAGATTACVLKKYAPELKVGIFEREIFPRDHVGESLLPRVTRVLHDIGVWDKMEAAGFAIKVGATYRWGNTSNLWHFDFIAGGDFKDAPRPGTFQGQRTQTAFQVDRSIYDKILLDHAEEMGAKVYQDVKVQQVLTEGDQVLGFSVVAGGELGATELAGADSVQARYYVDASGSGGLLRRAVGVGVNSPTTLRNIAIWDYWQNAEWAEHIGIGGTRIRVLSLGWGWIWFIPLGPTRTSIGLVTPADYLKQSGCRPEELYLRALEEEPEIQALLKNAAREDILQTTNDWNFISDRIVGENWFLAGDAAGFADPILSAGLTLAQGGAVRVADTILEMERGNLDEAWLRADYEATQRAQIHNHMAFADYWYSANACFTDLKEYCSEIARKSGLVLDAESAFQWLGTGGFAHDDLGAASNAHCRISSLRYNIDQMAGYHTKWGIEQNNVFELDSTNTAEVMVGSHSNGKIKPIKCLKREAAILPLHLAYGAMVEALKRESELQLVLERFVFEFKKHGVVTQYDACFWIGCETLEAMLSEHWVIGRFDASLPQLKIVATPTIFYYGWWDDRRGMINVNPQAGGSIVFTPDQVAEMERENNKALKEAMAAMV